MIQAAAYCTQTKWDAQNRTTRAWKTGYSTRQQHSRLQRASKCQIIDS